jgi:hypothetical protein
VLCAYTKTNLRICAFAEERIYEIQLLIYVYLRKLDSVYVHLRKLDFVYVRLCICTYIESNFCKCAFKEIEFRIYHSKIVKLKLLL